MAQIPRGDEGKFCPFNGRECSEVCHKCPMWVQIRGHNPNTGAEIDRWDCSFALTPLLLVENSQQQRQTAAAVNSFHNEMSRNHAATVLLGAERGAHVIKSTPIRAAPRHQIGFSNEGDAQ